MAEVLEVFRGPKAKAGVVATCSSDACRHMAVHVRWSRVCARVRAQLCVRVFSAGVLSVHSVLH